MMAEARSEKAKPRRSPFAVDAHLVRPRKQPSAQPTGLRGAQQENKAADEALKAMMARIAYLRAEEAKADRATESLKQRSEEVLRKKAAKAATTATTTRPSSARSSSGTAGGLDAARCSVVSVASVASTTASTASRRQRPASARALPSSLVKLAPSATIPRPSSARRAPPAATTITSATASSSTSTAAAARRPLSARNTKAKPKTVTPKPACSSSARPSSASASRPRSSSSDVAPVTLVARRPQAKASAAPDPSTVPRSAPEYAALSSAAPAAAIDTTRDTQVLGAMGWGTKGFRSCRPWNKGAKKAFPNMGVDCVCYSVVGLADGDGEPPVDAVVAPQSAAATAADRPMACVVQESGAGAWR